MYTWYKGSEKCYMLMMDVSAERNLFGRSEWKTAFRKSEWHKRGWTLQELLTPQVVEF